MEPENSATPAKSPSFRVFLSNEKQWVDGYILRKRKASSDQGEEPP